MMPAGPEFRLPSDIENRLRQDNPWWAGGPMQALPPLRRWAFQRILKNFDSGLSPAILLMGPRQVGKSTLQAQIIRHLMDAGSVRPREIFYVQFDNMPSWREFRKASMDPILHLAGWFERAVLQKPFHQISREGRTAYLFFDEIQNLPEWSSQLKHLVDHAAVKVMATGSSALRSGLGKESMAGRVSQVSLGPLRLSEIGALGGLELPPFFPQNGVERLLKPDFWRELVSYGAGIARVRDEAFRRFSERGGFPVIQARREAPWEEAAAQLKTTVIERMIQLDLRSGERKGIRRDARLIRETFRLACRYSGQCPSPARLAEEVGRVLQEEVTPKRILYYLDFLDQAMLVRLVEPIELRLARRKGHDKICLCDHGLRRAWLGEHVPLDPEGLAGDPDAATLAGRLMEGAIGYYLGEFPEFALSHLPAADADPDAEVDFVLGVGDIRIPVEVKYTRRVDELRDAYGLKRFLEKAGNRSSFGLLVTRGDAEPVLDPRIIQIPASSLMLLR